MTPDPASPPADLLETIVAATRRIVAVRQQREPMAALARRAERQSMPAGRFRSALDRPDGLRVIAECKRRSPSRGVLCREYDPAAIAGGYAAAGAAAISVLTEPTFFDGGVEHVRAVRSAVEIPILRKDFIVSEYQLFETKAAGADAVLLIVSALDRRLLASLHQQASLIGLDVLVEVHSAAELDIALEAGASIVGVNNRDLRTLAIDVRLSESLIAKMPPSVAAVSESGLRSAEDLLRLRRLGYRAFLIGERFMAERDPGAALRALLQRSVYAASVEP